MAGIIVDDYTRRGLFNHLQLYEAELSVLMRRCLPSSTFIQKQQLELSGERQLYCKLYDAGKWTNITGK